MSDFWDYLDELVASSRLVIDRPRGSHHPNWDDYVYPMDYGYLEGTRSADGSGVDVWSGSLDPPQVEAVLISVDLFKRDAEYSILVGCTPVEQETIMNISNRGGMRARLIPRNVDPLELFTSRRSVRRFSPRPVSPALIEQVLQAASRAPSAHNRQPWRYAVLETTQSRERLAIPMGEAFEADLVKDGLSHQEARRQVERSRVRICEAPAAVLLCLDRQEVDHYPDAERSEAAYLMAVQGVALASGYLLLAAHVIGLAGVWMCAPLFARQIVRKALALPDSWEPQALVLLGYAAKLPEPRTRKPLSEVSLHL